MAYETLLTEAKFGNYQIPIDRVAKLDGLEAPSYASSESVLVGTHGERFNQAVMRRRLISMEIWIKCQDQAEYLAKREALAKAMIKSDGEKEFRIVVGGNTFKLNCVPEAPEIDWPHTGYFRALIQLIAYDPVIYAVGEKVAGPAQPLVGGGYSFNYTFPYTFEPPTGSNRFTVLRGGQVVAFPIFRLEGLLTNPKITNETTGRFFKLDDYELAEGAAAVIDMTTPNRTAKLEGSGFNLAQYIDIGSTWFGFAEGINSIRLDTDSISDTGQLTARWVEGYVGI